MDDIRSRFRGTRRSSYGVSRGYGSGPSGQRPIPSKPPVNNQPATHAPVSSSPRRTKSGKKRLLAVLVCLLLIAAGAYLFVHFSKARQAASTDKASQRAAESPKPGGTVRLVAIGDSLAYESINMVAKTANGYDYAPLMSNFKPLFAKADIRLCNETTPGGGEALGVSGSPVFNAPIAWSTGFADTGCNLMNLASDHANDKGQPGIDAVVATWDSQPGVLAYAGVNRSAAEQTTIRYFTVKQVRFAYLAYTTKTQKPASAVYSVNVYNDETAKHQITEARKNANLVLVSVNWGNKDQEDISADQDRIAQNLADYGADVVIGGGPGVLQPAKILDGQDGHQTLVWFSLGNFLNAQVPVKNLIGGMAVMDFDVVTGQLKDPKLLPVYMHYEWTAAQKAGDDLNARTNFKLYPLDQATEALAKSQNATTVAEQTARVNSIVTKFAPIKVITAAEL